MLYFSQFSKCFCLVASQKTHHLKFPLKNHLPIWSLLPHLFRKIGHRYVNKVIKSIKIIHSTSIISDPNKMLTSRDVKSVSRWQRPNSGKIYTCRNHPQTSATKIFIGTGVLQQLVQVTCFILCISSDYLHSYTIFIPLFFFSSTPLHSYDDTTFTSISATYMDISKCGIMSFNYRVDSYIWEIRSEPRDYNPYIRNLSNLHRRYADSSISTL